MTLNHQQYTCPHLAIARLRGGSLGYKQAPTEEVRQTLDPLLPLPHLSYVTLSKWLTSLSLNFLSCQMGMLRVLPPGISEKIRWRNAGKACRAARILSKSLLLEL